MAGTDLHNILVRLVVNKVDSLEFDKNSLPEVEIGGKLFCIVAVHKHISIQSDHGAALVNDYASRVYIDCFPKPTANIDTDLDIWRTAAHIFVTDNGTDSSTSKLAVGDESSDIIVDIDSLRKATAVETSLLPCPRKISDIGNIHADALRATYQAYIDAINERKMTQTLPTYCHNIVTHNGKPLPLAEYQQLMESAQAAIPDLEFRIARTAVDSDKQMLAAKLDFRGTPRGEFAGVTPSEGAGTEVRFSEIVFYWFRDGKIAQVVSLVDLDAYRKQVTGQI